MAGRPLRDGVLETHADATQLHVGARAHWSGWLLGCWFLALTSAGRLCLDFRLLRSQHLCVGFLATQPRTSRSPLCAGLCCRRCLDAGFLALYGAHGALLDAWLLSARDLCRGLLESRGCAEVQSPLALLRVPPSHSPYELSPAPHCAQSRTPRSALSDECQRRMATSFDASGAVRFCAGSERAFSLALLASESGSYTVVPTCARPERLGRASSSCAK